MILHCYTGSTSFHRYFSWLRKDEILRRSAMTGARDLHNINQKVQSHISSSIDQRFVPKDSIKVSIVAEELNERTYVRNSCSWWLSLKNNVFPDQAELSSCELHLGSMHDVNANRDACMQYHFNTSRTPFLMSSFCFFHFGAGFGRWTQGPAKE